MKKQKTPQDVRGYKYRCINFIQCPVCYGCRNFDFRDAECLVCQEDSKLNLCTNKLHRPDLLSRMILRPIVKLDAEENEAIKFKSFDNN